MEHTANQIIEDLANQIIEDLRSCRLAIRDEYTRAIEEKDRAPYKSLDYFRAREKANALDTALLFFDMYTDRYLSAGD